MESRDGPTLLQTLQVAASALPDSVLQDRVARKELLAAASNLTAALETPADAINRIIFQPIQNVAVRIAIQLNLFELVSKGHENGTSATELASMTGGERLLVARIMRVLVAMGVFAETAPETYISTKVSKAFTIPAFRCGAIHLYDEGTIAGVKLPEYLERSGWKNPVDSSSGPFQYAFDTKFSLFEFFKSQPKRSSIFNTFMEGQRIGRPHWFDLFPVETLLSGLKQDDVLVVDVGGGRGHDLEAFQAKYPHQPGRLILQDLPQVIDDVGVRKGIEVMHHNFFTPQPVQGAKVYYFHYILHDWPDDACVNILRQTASAMTEGSRIIINDWVLHDTGADLLPSLIDILMMINVTGMERTKEQWRTLISQAGLEIVKFWDPELETEGVIEVALQA